MEIHGHCRAGTGDQRSVGVGNQIELTDRGSVAEKNNRISANGSALGRFCSTGRNTEFVSLDTTTLVASIRVRAGLITNSVLLLALIDVNTSSVLFTIVSVEFIAVANLMTADVRWVTIAADGALFAEVGFITTFVSITTRTTFGFGGTEFLHRNTLGRLVGTFVVGVRVTSFW